jgi:hypothetical protein
MTMVTNKEHIENVRQFFGRALFGNDLGAGLATFRFLRERARKDVDKTKLLCMAFHANNRLEGVLTLALHPTATEGEWRAATLALFRILRNDISCILDDPLEWNIETVIDTIAAILWHE